MSIIPTTKRERKNITQRMCEARAAKQTKHYDRQVSGLYVSVVPNGVATFSLKYTDPNTHKRSSIKVGIYHPELFTIEMARTAAHALRFRIGNGEDVAQTARQAKARQAKLSGVTVDQVIDERIEWMKTPVRKADGEMRPRIESWSNVASHLNRFVRPRLGKMIASEVTKADIAQLSNDIVAGAFGKPSVANARHMRRAASAMFKWAAQAGRDYVSASPCIDLPPLDEEHPRDRVLTEDEIRTLWHGLDREDMPWDRRTRLAIKFALTTMLRSSEVLGIHRNELNMDNDSPSVDIPARRVKKRRVINQPLSDLALEIIKESMGNYEYVFTGRFGDAPLSRQAMSSALTGTKATTNGKRVTRTPGICQLLGIAPFAPHDLRRSAATLCGELGLPEAGISLALDHQSNKDESGKPLPAVTRKVYNLATRARVAKKREVLDRWAAELRRIIGEPVEAADAEMHLAA
jgi:integrase